MTSQASAENHQSTYYLSRIPSELTHPISSTILVSPGDILILAGKKLALHHSVAAVENQTHPTYVSTSAEAFPRFKRRGQELTKPISVELSLLFYAITMNNQLHRIAVAGIPDQPVVEQPMPPQRSRKKWQLWR